MPKLIILFLLCTISAYSQDNFIGKSEITVLENGILKKKTIHNPLLNSGIQYHSSNEGNIHPTNFGNNTNTRWTYIDAVAIGDFCLTSGNGKYGFTSWNLNNERVSFYQNINATPLWEYYTDPNVYINFIAISDTGGIIAVGSYHNIFMFNNSVNVPFFNYDLTLLPDTGIATATDITNDGRFLVASASRQDSSTIFGFNSSSTTPVWKKRIVPTITAGGGSIQGIRMSGNDSLVIVNTYAEFYVFRTYTGQLIYQGLINPSSPNSGTQAPQGISGNGNIIATINYSGFIRVYQWNGTTYTLLWQNQEPPGLYFNWYTTVDVTYDGQNIAAGTLNFITSSSFDGKVKVFKTSGSGVPQWTYVGCGDEVSAVSFSRSGNILAASSWGEFNNLTEDLFIFKTFLGNIPIYKVNSPGSFFACNTSNDGKTVVASGKAVHARQFGNGGLLYNIDVDTSDVPTSVSSNAAGKVVGYNLEQNYPNPFNPKTIINYQLSMFSVRSPSGSFVSIKVYDIMGREVATLVNENLQPGSYETEWDASDYPSGIYFYKIKANDFVETKRMVLLK